MMVIWPMVVIVEIEKMRGIVWEVESGVARRSGRSRGLRKERNQR